MTSPEETAAWLLEAWQTGNPLAPFPPELAPANLAEGEAVAAALVEALGHPVIGIRLAPAPGGGWISAPLPEARMLRAGTPVALPGLRRPRASAALIGVLAEPLGEAPPVFASLHPGVDIASDRYRDGPADAAQAVADLGSVGLLLVGKRFLGPLPDQAEARIGPTGTRPRPVQENLSALMADGAAAARRWGGLPAGAVLVVAGLGGTRALAAAGKWSAAIGAIGRVNALLVDSADQPMEQGQAP
jgi:hypothetical protein